jgi:hypothetical protein
MFRRTAGRAFAATAMNLSGGGGDVKRYEDKTYPNQPHHIAEANKEFAPGFPGAFWSNFLDQKIPLYDDVVVGTPRVRWQEPARSWHLFSVDETLVLEEHDKEEWNEKPYVGVNHLYEPPVGCEERPIRVEAAGNPGDNQVMSCFGNCAPHIPQSTYLLLMKGYQKNKCPMCQQWFYIHNRPWLVMNPDWTDEPAADEGPAYTFAEVEAEFDRDFHEFSIYLNVE